MCTPWLPVAASSADDGERWVAARGRYLFPVDVLGALFRGKLLAVLDAAIARGDITMPGGPTQDPEAWLRLRDRLYRTKWHVYAKRPFGGAEQVIRYLGLYTHRVGISNHRLLSMDARGVTFRTKDGKTVTVSPSPSSVASSRTSCRADSSRSVTTG